MFNIIVSVSINLYIAYVETETGEKINDDIVGGGKAAAVDNIQPFDVEIDADEAESVKPTKKRKSKNSKTPAEEHILVAAHNTEPIKAADGEEPDKVLGSFKEKNETTEENMEETGKKSKKKHSLKVNKSPELSVEVNSTPLEETCHINSTNDSFVTPAKKDTETDASLLKKCYEENEGDMGDNFGCSQNQEKPDQMGGGGGVKSLKEKSGLDLQPSASTNVSLSSFKTKERKSG
ncbi:unnamed protein product [Eruca vesicaria subsp. sativa]|uniref:Uncharacterized protein n=1 Tax=Eruca vesicaria subsp. sativa TaxID=29727 RepID=A0ABC8KS85_ERUVS|nr:unnamed protein product [Eruca vesicaria subsp. sativa]